jgi:hypothetical protein
MKAMRFARIVLVSIALIDFCVPSVLLAANPAPQPTVLDVSLVDGGTLQGKVIDLQGGKTSGIPISLQTQNYKTLTTKTTEDGRFSIQGLRGGVYQVAAGQGQSTTYRLWSNGTAPPSAANNAIVYTQNGNSIGGLKTFLANPVVIAGVVATAVAVPVVSANQPHASP